MAMALNMDEVVVQYHHCKNGPFNRRTYINFMIKLLYQHLHEAANGMGNVDQIIEMIGRLIKYFSILLAAMELVSSCMLILLIQFQLNLLNGRHQLVLLIQVSGVF